MNRESFFIDLILAAGGIVTSAFMIQGVYRIIKKGSLESRHGREPISFRNRAGIYLVIIGLLILSTIIIIWGTIVLILRFLYS